MPVCPHSLTDRPPSATVTGRPLRRAGAARSTVQTRARRSGSGGGLWLGAPSALLSGHSRSIVGAAGSEATRTALAAGDFDTVYQCVEVFDLLGMVASTERARGHPLGFELHAPMVCAGATTLLAFDVKRATPEESGAARSTTQTLLFAVRF